MAPAKRRAGAEQKRSAHVKRLQVGTTTMLTLWFRFCRLAVDEYKKRDESRLRARGTDQDDAGQPSHFIRSWRRRSAPLSKSLVPFPTG
jgi:hypothetical protein